MECLRKRDVRNSISHQTTGKFRKGKYRTAWGYFAGVEFYPMDTNLHFFLTYVGRTYDFTARAKSLGQENYSTNRVSVGFIYQLPMF